MRDDRAISTQHPFHEERPDDPSPYRPSQFRAAFMSFLGIVNSANVQFTHVRRRRLSASDRAFSSFDAAIVPVHYSTTRSNLETALDAS